MQRFAFFVNLVVNKDYNKNKKPPQHFLSETVFIIMCFYEKRLMDYLGYVYSGIGPQVILCTGSGEMGDAVTIACDTLAKQLQSLVKAS